jgi:hypothetical protein
VDITGEVSAENNLSGDNINTVKRSTEICFRDSEDIGLQTQVEREIHRSKAAAKLN